MSTVFLHAILQAPHPRDLGVLAEIPCCASVFVPVDIFVDKIHGLEGAERGVGIGVSDVVLGGFAILVLDRKHR